MNTRNIKFTIGGPESSAGTAAARTKVIPIREKPGFREQAEKIEDPAIVGTNMVTGEYLGARDLNGSIPLSPRPVGGFGMLLNSLLGQEAAPVQIGAVARIRYNGDQESAKISTDIDVGTVKYDLISEIGDFGDEAGDAAFGTTGTIDLTNASFDTVTELVAVIAAYTNYDAELITGSGATNTDEIVAIVAEQGKGRWVYLFFKDAESGVYLHRWPVNLTNTQRPVYSIQGDGIHDNYLGTGVMVDAMTISGALKAMVEAEATAMGFAWTGSQDASTTSLESVDPFLYYDGSFSVNGAKQPFVRNISLEIGNNGDTDGYGMGSASRQYHAKGEFSVTASLQLRYSAAIYAMYAKVFNNAQAGLDVYFRTPGTIVEDIHGLLVLEAPYCNVSDYEASDNNGVLDASISLRVIAPPGAYGSPFRVSMITSDSAAY